MGDTCTLLPSDIPAATPWHRALQLHRTKRLSIQCLPLRKVSLGADGHTGIVNRLLCSMLLVALRRCALHYDSSATSGNLFAPSLSAVLLLRQACMSSCARSLVSSRLNATTKGSAYTLGTRDSENSERMSRSAPPHRRLKGCYPPSSSQENYAAGLNETRYERKIISLSSRLKE
ncbi:hypothetical protein Efla_005716 [Eimeria flavescens]